MDPIVKPVDPPRIRYRKLKAWVQLNSKPKPVCQPPKINRGPMFSNHGRIDELSKPLRKYVKPSKDPTCWEYIIKHLVKKSAKTYVPTERINELSKPRYKYEKYIPKKIRKSTLTYNPSQRIISLSAPRVPYKKVRQKPLVARKALKYKPSKRIIQLSQPQTKQLPEKQYVFTVNPITFKYFPTKRIRQMAKPKKILTIEEVLEREEERMTRKKAYDERRAKKLQKQKEARLKRHAQERRMMGI